MNSLRINILNGKEIQRVLPVSVALATLLAFTGQYVIYACAALIIVLFAVVFREKFIYGFVIVTLFTLVGDVSQSLRPIVQITDFVLIGYLFIKRFGLQFHSYPQIPGSLIYFLLLYYLSMIVSILMSDYPFAGVMLVVRQTLFFIIAYFFYALIRDGKDIKTYFVAFLIAACVLAASTVLRLLSESSSFLNLAEGSRERVVGLISNPNNITNFYMVAFPLVFGVFLLRKSVLSKNVSLLLMLYLGFALFITLSRSAILGIIASTVIMAYILRKKYFYFIILPLILLVMLFIIYEPLGNLASTLFRVERGVTGRDYLWGLSLDIIKDHPIFGLGPGAYKYEMFKYFPVMLNSWVGGVFIDLYEMTGGANLSHNFFLLFFSEMGILGLMTALLFPLIFFRIGIKTLKKYKNGMKDEFYLIVSLFSIGSAMFIRSIVESIGLLYYGAITTDLPFWLVFISLIYYYNHVPDYPSKEKEDMLEQYNV